MEIVIALFIAVGLIAQEKDDHDQAQAAITAAQVIEPATPLPVCDVAFADLSQRFEVRQYRNLAGSACRLSEE